MAKTTHLHSRHRGTIPADQLAAGTPAEGDVIVWQSDGSMAWEAPASVEHEHEAVFLEGEDDPSDVGVEADLGTFYIRRYLVGGS